jgi:hypothetical protein
VGSAALLLGKNSTLKPEDVWAALDCDSTPNKVNGADGSDSPIEEEISPNKMLYSKGGCLRDDGTIAPVDVSNLPFNVEDRRRRIPAGFIPTRPPPVKFKFTKEDEAKINQLRTDTAGAVECFPGDATVQVNGRGRTLLSSVHEGDNVLVQRDAGTFVSEPVLGFLHLVHGGPSKTSLFLTVVHSKGEHRATGNHIVFVLGSANKAVDQLQVGDQLLATEGPSAVLAIRRDTGNSGMFAPVTHSGTLVVDGVLASSYATPGSRLRLPHSVAHSIFFPLRMYHRLGGSVFRQDGVNELHPYAHAVQEYLHLGKFYKLLTF